MGPSRPAATQCPHKQQHDETFQRLRQIIQKFTVSHFNHTMKHNCHPSVPITMSCPASQRSTPGYDKDQDTTQIEVS